MPNFHSAGRTAIAAPTPLTSHADRLSHPAHTPAIAIVQPGRTWLAVISFIDDLSPIRTNYDCGVIGGAAV